MPLNRIRRPAGPGSLLCGPAGSGTARSAAKSALLLAPHGRRVWAFVFDLAVVGILALVPGGVAAWLFDRQTDASSLTNLVVLGLALAAALCAYSTATSWLTDGQTPGNAMLGLAVRWRTGAPPGRDLRGLAWVAGRSSVGYIVIDVSGLGMLVGLLTRGRRCLQTTSLAAGCCCCQRMCKRRVPRRR